MSHQPPRQRRRHPPVVHRLLHRTRPRVRAVGKPDPARSDAAVQRGRHGPVQAVLPRRRDPAVQTGGQLAEVRARRWQTQRPRRRRAHEAPPRVLRDARQLQLRRLLQGVHHPGELGAGHRGLGARRRPHVDHDPRERRRGRGDLARTGRRADGPDPAPGRLRELLAGGRDRPVRSLQRDPHRPRCRVRPRRRPAQRQAGRPVHGVLEPRLHAVRPRRGGLVVAAAEAVDRHRGRPGAGRDAAPGRRLGVGDRSLAAADRRGGRADGNDVPAG